MPLCATLRRMEKLSVCVITKNEAANIERCLRSVAWADELVVFDSGSTDDTVARAKALGAQVTVTNWPGWAKQKNRCIEAAAHDWVLSLDADEWLPEGCETEVRNALTQPPTDAYTLPRKTFFLGKWIAHQGWYPDRQIRLFRKSATRFSEVPVHEKVEETPHTAALNVPILHESYVSLKQYFEKNRAYSTAQAKQQQAQGMVWLKLLVKPPARFVQTYLFQLGFLDGWQGLLLSILRSWYDFRVLWQVRALQRTARQSAR